jgi:DNA-binding transcriptional LysR family regulator
LIIDQETNNMDIEFRHIAAFKAVAETLNFKKASEVLFMTQPGLTRIIKRLEDDLGVQLFTRTTRSVALTEAGTIFLKEIRPAIEKIKVAINHAQSVGAGNMGYLRIAYMGFAINGILPNILRSFNQKYPGIRTDLFYMPTEAQKKKIIESELDVGFLIGPFSSPGIEQQTVSIERLMVVMFKNHPFANKTALSMKDLKSQPFILGTPKDWKKFLPMIVELSHKANFHPSIRQYVDTSEGIFGLVAAGLGITIYTESAVTIRNRDLIAKPLVDEDAVITTIAAWLKSNQSQSLTRFKTELKRFCIQ